MYPSVPYDGMSWPMTQHAGVLDGTVIDGLLNACILCNGKKANPEIINGYLVEHGILTANFRADSGQSDAWRDYQQILSEFGLLVSTRVSKEIRLTPVALAYLENRITFNELITLQVLRYQYPNGHKSQLSQSLIDSYGKGFTFENYTEMQDELGIQIRPAVLVWQALFSLWQHGETSVVITLDEMQKYLVRCMRQSDIDECVKCILKDRHEGISLSPLSRARRNMADWMKIMGQTLLFKINYDCSAISMSSYSITHSSIIANLCNQMSNPTSFWHYEKDDYKRDWFLFYGDFDNNTDWVLKE